MKRTHGGFCKYANNKMFRVTKREHVKVIKEVLEKCQKDQNLCSENATSSLRTEFNKNLWVDNGDFEQVSRPLPPHVKLKPTHGTKEEFVENS